MRACRLPVRDRIRDPGPGRGPVLDSRPESGSVIVACARRTHFLRIRCTMYEMYPWNPPEEENEEAVAAVQIALDRRDNGGSPAR